MEEAAPRPKLSERARNFYRDHEPACTVAFFVLGFFFDAMFIGRIDELRGIAQQGVYLLLCALFTGYELREQYGDFAPPDRFKTVWRYNAAATHFMLGTLLNIYTLFYFKSASLGTSFLFLLILVGLLAANELKPFGGSGTTLRLSLFSLCLVSYFTYLVPTLVGFIGVLPFLGTLVVSSACIGLMWLWLKGHMKDPRVLVPHLLTPFGVVALVFAGLYFTKVLPPVPLSLSDIGVYHDVTREGGEFKLTETRPRWRFWERGDQTFLARPDDKIFCYVQVFSPGRFKERLQLRWLRKDEGVGWEEEDAIPLDTAGGREEGWRGFVVKSRWKPGQWRVRVETSDGRELGRLGFSISPDETTGPRETRELLR
jgi:hypothetical protein